MEEKNKFDNDEYLKLNKKLGWFSTNHLYVYVYRIENGKEGTKIKDLKGSRWRQ